MRLKFGGLGLNIADNRNRTINSDCPLKIIWHFEHVGPIYLSFLCIFISPSKNIFSDFSLKKVRSVLIFTSFRRNIPLLHTCQHDKSPVNCLVIKTIFAEKCESNCNVRTGNLAVLMCWVNIAVIHATLADWPILTNAWAELLNNLPKPL